MVIVYVMTSSTPHASSAARQRRTVLISVCLALMAVVASVSGLNVAQAQMALTFHASQTTVLWIINSYALTLAALLFPLGAVGDRLGRRPVLLVGLVIFGAASAVAGLAPTAAVMIIARLAGGVGAAMIMPVTLAIITSTFPDEARSRAIGVWSGVAGAGGLLGMFLAAVLVDVASWRYQFVLPVVLATAAVVMTLRSIPNSRDEHAHRFDGLGALASALAVVALVFGIQEGPNRGWADPLTATSLAIGVIAALGFVLWERRRAEPMFDVKLFISRGLATGSGTLLATFAVMGGIFVVLYPYFEVVLGWSAVLSTLGAMPMALLMMITSGLAPRIAEKIGRHATMSAGVAMTATGLALMAGLVSATGGYLSILPGVIVIGFGAGLAMTPATEAITGSLPRAEQGVASALNDITREFGTALGVALLGAIVTDGYRRSINTHLAGMPAGTAAAAREGVANAVHAALTAGARSGDLIDAARNAFIHGWQQAMWVGVGVMVLLLAYVIVRSPQSPSTAHEPPEPAALPSVGASK
jgi:EmrB/QacA subfamily drug resistance transporter